MHDKESDQDLPPGNVHNQYGKHNPQRVIDHLGYDQNRPLFRRVRELAIGQLALQVTAHLLEVRGYSPVDGQQSVEENRIEFLKLMNRKPLRML